MPTDRDWEANRREVIRKIEGNVQEACFSAEPIDSVTAEMLVACCIAGSPLFDGPRVHYQTSIRAARQRGRFWRDPDGVPRFQQALKSVIWKYWCQTRDLPGSDIRYQSLHRHYYPSEGVLNFLDYRTYKFVRPMMQAGATIVFTGQKGGGKTKSVCWHFGELSKLKHQQLELRAEGRERECELAIQRAGAGWNLKAVDDDKDDDYVGIEEGEGALAQLEEPDVVRGKAKEKFGFYTATGVRLVTNIAFRTNTPLAAEIVHISKMSDLMIGLGESDIAGNFTMLGMDEAATIDEKQRSMTKQAHNVRMVHAQIRKYNSIIAVTAQSQKHQLRDQIIEEADMRVVCYRPRQGRYRARYTIPGTWQDQMFTNVSDTDIDFISRHKTALLGDLRVDLAWEYGEACRRQAHDAGEEWTHEQDILAVNDWIRRNRTPEAAIQAGRNPYVEQEVRAMIENDHRAGVHRTAEEIMLRVPDLRAHEHVIREQLAFVAERERQEKEAREKGTLPRYKTDPEAVAPNA